MSSRSCNSGYAAISAPRLRAIAAAIAKDVGVPAKSVTAEEAPTYLGGMAHFAHVNNPTSSARTRALLHWEPTHPSLLADLVDRHYFAATPAQQTALC